MKAVALANNDVALVAWRYESKIEDCLGFAVYRIDLNSRQTAVLPAWVGFKGQSNKDWHPSTTEVWPVQKFNWRDLTARRDGFYQYKIVPMIGSPGSLTPLADHTIATNPVHLTPNRGSLFSYFNRGILSTQSLAHQIPSGPGGQPNYRKLIDRIDQPGDPLRNRLAGDMRDALMLLLNRARTNGGECYAALYELNDPELLQLLIGAPFVHLILSNTGKDDETNVAARQTLHESGVDITDRMLSGDHIGHNKFVVYVDSQNVPQTVLAGSTNWTYTGLCGQSNNSLLIDSPDLAKAYLDYWNRLKADAAKQGADFRAKNETGHQVTLPDGTTTIHLWFSPNTPQKAKPKSNPKAPPDMEEVFSVINGARQAVLFLAFIPGKPSIMDAIEDAQQANPKLFVRGALTDRKTAEAYNVQLFHRTGIRPDATVVPATAVNDEFSFWRKELLKTSPTAHAIIHDKIVVVDPFSPGCVVITGSHNLGYKASYSNDENLLILRGNRAIAESYTTHVMDVYDHYRWRYTLQTQKSRAWSGLEKTDAWQDKYFAANSKALNELDFWASAT